MSFCLFFPKKSQRPLLLFLKLLAFSEHQLIFDVPPLPLGCLFGGVLLFGDDAAQLVLQWLSVVQVFDFVDPDKPVLRGKGLLQVLELDVLVADLHVSCPVEARRRPEVQLE